MIIRESILIARMDIESLLPDFPMRDSPIEIEETYRLEHGNLVEIIQKINSLNKKDTSESTVLLRQNGIEIYGKLEKKDKGMVAGVPFGMIVTGTHLKKDPTAIYLVTFKSKDQEYRELKPTFNLVDLLRKYII